MPCYELTATLATAEIADDVPEIAELDLNPVIAGPDGRRPWMPASG